MRKGHLGILAFLIVGILILGISIITNPKEKTRAQQQFTIVQNYEVTIKVDGKSESYYTYGIPLCVATDIEFKCESIGGPNVQLFWDDWKPDQKLLYSASAKAGVTFTQANYQIIINGNTLDWYNQEKAKYDELKKEWDATHK